jgi:hypothetical protein
VEDVKNKPTPAHPSSQRLADHAVEEILIALQGLRFGSLNIIVQDGLVIQIDRTEKRRIKRPNQGT